MVVIDGRDRFSCGAGGACSPEKTEAYPGMNPGENTQEPDDEQGPADNDEDQRPGQEVTMNVQMTIDGKSFSVILAESAAAKAFAEMLPMTVTMTELNGNEKYYTLSQSLPVEPFRPGIIRSGDLLLWGGNTVVLFYETFSSPYSYTRLGSIDDPEGLAEAVGSGNVVVSFDI